MKDLIEIGGVWLRRVGDRVIVSVEIEGVWQDVISEHAEGAFSHIVEPGGMREGKETSRA
jgi:hypothetical protein